MLDNPGVPENGRESVRIPDSFQDRKLASNLQGWLRHGVPLRVGPQVPLEVTSTGASLGGLRYWSVTEQNRLWGYPGLFLQSLGLS